ncbi:MAG: GntR family transcriptional regulator [Bacillota bacterium]|jgi:DNA-binding GntR family transcriptional regulator
MKKNQQGKSKVLNKNKIAYESIRNLIVTNELKAGDIITENVLAEQLGMSRTPIREAIKILSKEGFLEIHNGVGTYVKHITVKDILDINEVRTILESTALKTAVRNIKRDDLIALLNRWIKLKEHLEANPGIDPSITAEIYKLDAETHSFIVDNCDNQFLKEVYDDVRLKVQRFQRMITNAVKDDLNTVLLHIRILEYIKDGDIEAAADLIRRHVFDSLQNVLKNNDINLFLL